MQNKKFDAIIVQGGGPRGAFAAGALNELTAHGVHAQEGYGVSAGAVNCAYFLTGQMRELKKLYCDLLQRESVIDYKRWRSIIDLDKLMEITKKEAPLEHPADGLPLTVAAFKADTYEVIYRRLHGHTEPQVYQWLLATSAIPLFYGKKIHIDGSDYIDGGLGDNLPLLKAVSDGHKKLLVVMTQPPSKQLGEIPKNVYKIFRHDPELAHKAAANRKKLYAQTLEHIADHPYDVLAITPKETLRVSPAQRDGEAAQLLWQQGIDAAKSALANFLHR